MSKRRFDYFFQKSEDDSYLGGMLNAAMKLRNKSHDYNGLYGRTLSDISKNYGIESEQELQEAINWLIEISGRDEPD